MALLFRVFFCIFIFGLLLYFYIDEQNALTRLRIEIPVLEKEVRVLEEEIARLQFQVERFESPVHLLKLARQPEFGRFKHPYTKDILILPQGEPLTNGQGSREG